MEQKCSGSDGEQKKKKKRRRRRRKAGRSGGGEIEMVHLPVSA